MDLGFNFASAAVGDLHVYTFQMAPKAVRKTFSILPAVYLKSGTAFQVGTVEEESSL